MDELVSYFEDEWLIQNRIWHEGFKLKTPSHNNALEAFNRVIKDEQTLRERLDFSQFRVILFNMVHQWSVEYSSGLNKINMGAPTIELKMWTEGYNFARSNVKVVSERHGNQIIYRTPGKNAVVRPIACTAWKTFNDFKQNEFGVIHTTFEFPITSENWMFSSCDCS